jgi:hypothetical protein
MHRQYFRGGQFIPGGRRAPQGGIWINAPVAQSTTTPLSSAPLPSAPTLDQILEESRRQNIVDRWVRVTWRIQAVERRRRQHAALGTWLSERRILTGGEKVREALWDIVKLLLVKCARRAVQHRSTTSALAAVGSLALQFYGSGQAGNDEQ